MEQPLPFSPTASLDVYWDFSDWLQGGAIASYVITPPAGVVYTDDSQVAGIVVAWLSLQAPVPVGNTYSIACKVTTDHVPPRIDTRTITIQVMAR